MPNQTVNKVQFGGQTVMDITDTTADAADVIEGEVFYSKSGARSVGSLGDATQSTHGLMSANDKVKLDSISGNVYTDYQLTIDTTDWTLDDTEYVYTWSSIMVTSTCLINIFLQGDPEELLNGELSFNRTTGSLTFITAAIPNDDIDLVIRIIDSDTSFVAATATTTTAGFMSATDKAKLDGLIIPTNVSAFTNDSGYLTSVATMTGASSSSAGTSGLVPAPASGDEDKVLKGDGTWGVPPVSVNITSTYDSTTGDLHLQIS